MAEYITISEFAKMANISRQAVYKRLDKDLKGYIVRESNKLKINVDAIHMIDTGVSKKSVEEVTDDENASNLADLSVTATVTDVTAMANLIDKKEQQINHLIEIIQEQNKAIELLITRQCKRSFWRKLIPQKNQDFRDIEKNKIKC